MQYTWQLALVLVPVYFIKHSVSCYIYYIKVIQSLPCFIYGHVASRHKGHCNYDYYDEHVYIIMILLLMYVHVHVLQNVLWMIVV